MSYMIVTEEGAGDSEAFVEKRICQSFSGVIRLKDFGANNLMEDDKNWYLASLRLSGNLLPIDEIETKLELTASSIGKKGVPLNRYKSQVLNTPMKTNVWCSEYLTEDDVPLENQIEIYLEKLESKKEVLKEILSLPDVEGEFFLGFSSENGQGGAYFTPELLKRVADLGLAISLDLYPPSEFEEENS